MSKRLLAIIAATLAGVIYAINHTIAKDVMPTHIKPFGFIMLRVTGAAILFWLISPFVPSEKIDKKDRWRFVACALFGMCLNMLAFFKGLYLSTPINSSVIVTLSPVILLLLSVVFLKERVSWLKFLGIGLGFTGALVLILFGADQQANASNIPLGNILLMVNATSYAVYLILVKPITNKYSTITLMKWFFLIGVILNIPFGLQEFIDVSWTSLPLDAMGIMAFVVIGTTFMTYLLNVYALKTLSPSTIGAFIYLQPLLAVLFAVLIGADHLSTIRILAAVFIFIGVYLSSRKPKHKKPKDLT